MSDSIPSLQLWLDRMRQGDPAARNELIRHCRERFRLLTRQMMRRFPGLREWEETSDVLQNVLIRIDRVLLSIDVATPLDLIKLATKHIRCELIDLKRHHFGPEGRGTHQVPPGQNGDGFPEPADRAADPYDLGWWSAWHEAIANLPEDEREVVEMLYYQGLKRAEAAALLEIPLRTFERRWMKARCILAAQFEDDLPF
jgi:RNA polymerase sigma factor (sigma-70 family)